MPAARRYVRPMTGWWRKNPFFVRYMIREGSAPLFYAYALWLVAGLVALARGREAYAAWWSLATQPLVIVLNAVVLAFALHHTWTWFHLLPKTLPDSDVAPRTLTVAGLSAAAVTSLALFAFAWVATR